MRSSRVPRLVRGFLAASVATFVALLSHVTGGGTPPSWVGVVVPLVVSIAVCVVLAGHRLSFVRLAIAVIASQALFHFLFVLGTFSPSPDLMSARPHDHVAVLAMPMTGEDMTVVSAAGAAMWIAHALAAAITVAALYRGERAILRLCEIALQLVTWVRRRVAVLVLPTPMSAPHRVRGASEWVMPALSLRVVSVSHRRGPPLRRVV